MTDYNDTLQSTTGEVTHTAVTTDDRAWKQATLLVKLAGLDVSSAVEAASSAYLTFHCMYLVSLLSQFASEHVSLHTMFAG